MLISALKNAEGLVARAVYIGGEGYLVRSVVAGVMGPAGAQVS